MSHSRFSGRARQREQLFAEAIGDVADVVARADIGELFRAPQGLAQRRDLQSPVEADRDDGRGLVEIHNGGLDLRQLRPLRGDRTGADGWKGLDSAGSQERAADLQGNGPVAAALEQ